VILIVDAPDVDVFVASMKALCEKLDAVVMEHAKSTPEEFASAVVLGAAVQILAGAVLASEDPADSLVRTQIQLFAQIRRAMHNPLTCPACLAGAETDPTEH
jgi:ABC-type nitrate/sulfonate/bicarbonate transport system permease component